MHKYPTLLWIFFYVVTTLVAVAMSPTTLLALKTVATQAGVEVGTAVLALSAYFLEIFILFLLSRACAKAARAACGFFALRKAAWENFALVALAKTLAVSPRVPERGPSCIKNNVQSKHLLTCQPGVRTLVPGTKQTQIRSTPLKHSTNSDLDAAGSKLILYYQFFVIVPFRPGVRSRRTAQNDTGRKLSAV
ncbi:hypothetical protein B0H13DRAFT_2262484 [Mycena leptocephala]|nr:hypothetical protein B0H13DRAFT_2262484 [Mycena leptocephala]